MCKITTAINFFHPVSSRISLWAHKVLYPHKTWRRHKFGLFSTKRNVQAKLARHMPTAPISVLTEFSIPGQTLTPRQDDRIKVTSLPKESSMPTQNSIYPLKIRYGQSVLGHLDYWQVHPIHHLSCSSAGSLSGSLGLVHDSVAASLADLLHEPFLGTS